MRSFDEWLYPELRYVNDPAERAQILTHLSPRRRAFRIFLSLFCFVFAVMAVLDSLAPVLFGSRTVTKLVLGSPIVGIGSALIIALLQVQSRKRDRAVLRQQLRDRGYSVCIGCGYDLRGQTTPRCPECGTAFDAERLPARADGAQSHDDR